MPVEINQISTIDLDVYGRSSQSGGALVHENDFAISNAIIFFLTSTKGDYLYRDFGGALKEMTFKLLSENRISKYQSDIQSTLNTEFGGIIREIEVSIIPNYDKKYFEIQVFYTSRETQQTNQAIFYTQPKTSISDTTVNFTEVYFEGDNLLAFVTLQKEQGLTKPLVKSSDGIWYWGNFKLMNFNENSSNFQEIFDIIMK